MILKSNNSIVIAGQKPAFTTDDRTGTTTMSGAYMSAVQSVSIGFSQARQKSKQVGSSSLIINDTTRMPDVDLNIDYYYTPVMLNENLIGLSESNPSYAATGFFDNYTNEDQNFYVVNHVDQGADMIQNGDSVIGDLTTSSEAFCVGNAFLNNYSLNFSVGSLPVVSTSYKCSNISVINGPFSGIQNPAINLLSGNNNDVGLVDLTKSSISGFDYYGSINRFNPPLCGPDHLELTLQNLQVGGAPISGDAHIQSFSFDIPIDRTDLYGLGSDYPYGRKVMYPITASVNLQLLVSGVATGQLSGLVDSESSYDFDVKIQDRSGEYQNTFSFDSLRLESSAYSMDVNENMNYSLGFSFEIENQ